MKFLTCPCCGKKFTFFEWLMGDKYRHEDICKIRMANRLRETRESERRVDRAAEPLNNLHHMDVPRVTPAPRPAAPPRPTVSTRQATGMALGAGLGGVRGMQAGLHAARCYEDVVVMEEVVEEEVVVVEEEVVEEQRNFFSGSATQEDDTVYDCGDSDDSDGDGD